MTGNASLAGRSPHSRMVLATAEDTAALGAALAGGGGAGRPGRARGSARGRARRCSCRASEWARRAGPGDLADVRAGPGAPRRAAAAGARQRVPAGLGRGGRRPGPGRRPRVLGHHRRVAAGWSSSSPTPTCSYACAGRRTRRNAPRSWSRPAAPGPSALAGISARCRDQRTVPGSAHGAGISARCRDQRTVPGSAHGAGISARCRDQRTVLNCSESRTAVQPFWISACLVCHWQLTSTSFLPRKTK